MKYDVNDIQFCITPEDVKHLVEREDVFALASDYLQACEDKIGEIEEALPSELTVDIDDEETDIYSAISDAITDQTGWWAESFHYEPHPEMGEMMSFM